MHEALSNTKLAPRVVRMIKKKIKKTGVHPGRLHYSILHLACNCNHANGSDYYPSTEVAFFHRCNMRLNSREWRKEGYLQMLDLVKLCKVSSLTSISGGRPQSALIKCLH